MEEPCDDGNQSSGDGCSNACRVEPGWSCAGSPSVCTPSCGNGVVDAGEGCDDGGTTNGNGCSAACTVENGYTCTGSPSVCTRNCGNGTVGTGEACDDGNPTSGDGCSAACQLESTTAVCAGVPTAPGTAIRSALVVSGLARPTYVTSPPLDPNRLFVTEQPGCIRVVREGALQSASYLDLRAKVLLGDEQGLLSLAFHPDF